MDDVVIGALSRIFRENRAEILGDVRRLEALLRDYCPNSRVTVNLVLIALRERVPHAESQRNLSHFTPQSRAGWTGETEPPQASLSGM